MMTEAKALRLQRRPLKAGFCKLGAALVAAGALASGGALAANIATPAISGVVAANTPIELIKEGFNGTEGPIALPDGSLAFTETPANRITRIAPDGSTSTFLDDTNGSNALAFNSRGELITVQVKEPKVGIIYPKDRAKVLAENFEGAPFSRPNDLVVDKKGGVYFTDSGNAPRPADAAAPAPASHPAVYYISPAGKLKRLADDIERPNGIQLSRDEKTLYVANTLGEYVLAYEVGADGSISGRRNFAKLGGFEKTDNGWSSGADGLAIDGEGRLYVASNLGIQVFGSGGEVLGIIELPKKPQNLAFAGPGKKTLYIVGRGSAYKISTLTSGFSGRAK